MISNMCNGLFYFLLSLVLFACSTPSLDSTSNYSPAIINTRVNIEPLTREQRIKFSNIEKQKAKNYLVPLTSNKDQLMRARADFIEKINDEFPECKKQNYCNSQTVNSDIKKIQRYNELLTKLHYYDYQIVNLNNQIADIERRLSLNLRFFYNRYLINEFLKISQSDPRIISIMIHSLEGFSDVYSIQRKLLSFTKDIEFAHSSDYQFKMFGNLVDEAGVIVTFEVLTTQNKKTGKKFLLSLFVNSYDLDDQFYEKTFLKSWAQFLLLPNFDEKKQLNITNNIYCGLYSIASDSLASKMILMRKQLCTVARSQFQTPFKQIVNYPLQPELWAVPLAYYELISP